MMRSFCLPRHALKSHPIAQNSLYIRRTFAYSVRQYVAKPRLRSTRPRSLPEKITKTSSLKSKQNAVASDSPPETSITPSITSTPTYPNAIRIYSRSAPRIALLGIIRLTPFVLVTLWTLNVGAAITNDPTPVNWPQVLQAGAAFLPIFVVVPWTSGYVARILVQLPLEARRSKDALVKWAEKIPSDTLLEIKTVRANGFGWATTQCRLDQLRARKPSLWNQANFERAVDPSQDKRRTGGVLQRLYAWISEPPRCLKIVEEEGVKNTLVKAPWVWPAVVRRIEQRRGVGSGTGTRIG